MFVFLSDYQSDFEEITKAISMKLGGGVEHMPRKMAVHLGADPNWGNIDIKFRLKKSQSLAEKTLEGAVQN